ncbi:MAG TPA: MBL fold metallo-hydrolase, partial [Gemmatimonadaceae bacterium]|nr:MBL fold metallo-hydrolase [Gemmatimonadaceae bacterium]
MPSRLRIALFLLVTLGVTPLSGQASTVPAPAQRSSRPPSLATLDIYIVDTEGGKAALYVTPSSETVLIDTGNPGARDLDRILEVFKVAGVTRIDHLISTHYHQDHVGGLAALAQRIPVAHYLDHGANVENPEQVSGFRAR